MGRALGEGGICYRCQGAGWLLRLGTLPYQARGQMYFSDTLDRISSTYGTRAIAEELAEERGGLPEGSDKSDFDLKTLKKKADLGRPDFAGKGDKSFCGRWSQQLEDLGHRLLERGEELL